MTALTHVETEVIQFFVRLAQSLSMPKSIGEIFGLLYCSEEPLSFDDVVARLGISRGSVSQGLRFLQKIGAVKTVYVARDRRSFYEAEIRMRRLLGGFLNENVLPHLQSGDDHLEQIFTMLDDSEEDNTELLRQRLESLRQWNKKARKFLPLLMRMTALSSKT